MHNSHYDSSAGAPPLLQGAVAVLQDLAEGAEPLTFKEAAKLRCLRREGRTRHVAWIYRAAGDDPPLEYADVGGVRTTTEPAVMRYLARKNDWVAGLFAFLREMRQRAENDRASGRTTTCAPAVGGSRASGNGSTRNAPGDTENAVQGPRATQSFVLEGLCVAGGGVVSPCAFTRMWMACARLVRLLGRPPTAQELLERYEEMFDAGPEHPARRKRARQVADYAAGMFNWSAASPAVGYAAERPRLLALVRTCCVHRESSRRCKLSDDDLAIGLYTIERSSFGLHEDPRLQWTVGHDALAGMLDVLRKAGLTCRRSANRHVTGAIFRTLEAAGLIECLDRKYIPAGKAGIYRKWVVGPAHPKYSEFVMVSEGVRVVYVGIGNVKTANALPFGMESCQRLTRPR